MGPGGRGNGRRRRWRRPATARARGCISGASRTTGRHTTARMLSANRMRSAPWPVRSRVVRGRLPRGRLTRDDASYRESERGVGDARSASLKAHGRWLADGPGRTMTGGRFGGAALRPGANVAVAEGGRTDAAGPSRQARTQGPGVCSAARPRARLHVWNARLHVGIRGLAWRRPQKRRPRSAMRFAPPHPRTHHFGPGLRGHSRTPARSSRSEARHVRMAGRPRRR